MKQSRNWATIERLSERPGVAVMVGNGYWLDGKFHPTSPLKIAKEATGTARRPGLFKRIIGDV